MFLVRWGILDGPAHRSPWGLNTAELIEPTHNALTVVTAYIAKQKKNVVVIAVGGAVNTIFLRTRTSTHDVDFFNNLLTPADFALLVGGAKEACKAQGVPIVA